MADKSPDVLRDAPNPKWDDDPYRGVDVSVMRELLMMTPAERFWWAVDSANNVMRIREAAHRK